MAKSRGPKNEEVQSLGYAEFEPSVAVTPLTGLRLSDLFQSGRRVAFQGARQPLIFGKHAASHARKLIEILADNSQLAPDPRDRRFRDEVWQRSGAYKRLLQSYIALNQSLGEWADDLDLDQVDQLRAEFLLRMIGDAMAPTNTLLGNPAALRKARETKGKSLIKGLANLIDDVRHNHGMPAQVKRNAFTVGKDLATSEGAVVFRNEVLELIQYSPTTPQVFPKSVLLVSAMINKFYAFDMTPDRSMVQFCLRNGLQVFAISWANPRKEHSDWGIDTYANALSEAVEAVRSITRNDLNLMALCSGGMVASTLAAYMSKREDHSLNSLSIGVCMLDMQRSDMEMSAFFNEGLREEAKKRSKKAGILKGHELAQSMLWLRPNDLIWANVVNNYLLGNEPPEFDLLHWNNDRTNLPAKLHSDVIDMFATGCLLETDEMTLNGITLDLQGVDCDKFFVGGSSDHITPWKACYRAIHAYGGRKEFVLSDSGHIQTFLNSPGKKNAGYYMNPELPATGEEWIGKASLIKGSWWEYWFEWVSSRSGKRKRAPRNLGNLEFPTITPAPGTYVFQRSE